MTAHLPLLQSGIAPWQSAAWLDNDTIAEVAQDREIWLTAWLRQVQLQVEVECRIRRIRVWPVPGLVDACVLDRSGKFPGPSSENMMVCRARLVWHWRDMVDSGTVPVWTDRGPPPWLEEELWRPRLVA